MRRLAAFSITLLSLSTSTLAAAQNIAPPPPMDPNAQGAQQAEVQQNQKLDEAESNDSGRGLELFFLNGEVGGTFIDMRSLSNTSLQVKKASSGGPAFALDAGVRFFILYAGAKVRYNALSSFKMWQLDGEVGLKLPLGKLDVFAGLHGGYSFVGNIDRAALDEASNVPTNTDDVSIHGVNAGIDVGADYYLSSLLSVGVGAFGDALFLSRPKLDAPSGLATLPADQQQAIANDLLYQASGKSIGLEVGGAVRIGLHFGL